MQARNQASKPASKAKQSTAKQDKTKRRKQTSTKPKLKQAKPKQSRQAPKQPRNEATKQPSKWLLRLGHRRLYSRRQCPGVFCRITNDGRVRERAPFTFHASICSPFKPRVNRSRERRKHFSTPPWRASEKSLGSLQVLQERAF